MVQKLTAKLVVFRIFIYIFLVALAIIMLFPFWFMFIGGFRTNDQIYSMTIHLLPENGFGYLTNFLRLYEIGFLRNIWNTLFVAGTRTIGGLFLCAMAGFSFAKLEFPGKRWLFSAIVFTMMIPWQVTIIPNYLLMNDFGWTNRYEALIIPGIVNGFGIFLMRQYMISIPGEVLDSGRIDGCGNMALFFRIALPLSPGGFVILGIVSFMGTWNDYFWPLIIISEEKLFTITLRLASLRGMYYYFEYGAILGGAFISSLPMIIMFILLRKKLLAGIMSGSFR